MQVHVIVPNCHISSTSFRMMAWSEIMPSICNRTLRMSVTHGLDDDDKPQQNKKVVDGIDYSGELRQYPKKFHTGSSLQRSAVVTLCKHKRRAWHYTKMTYVSNTNLSSAHHCARPPKDGQRSLAVVQDSTMERVKC